MASRRIIAVFDSQADARRAREELISLGLRDEQVNIVDQSTQERTEETTSGNRTGFWAHVKELFIPDEDRATIDESIRRGGYVLSATVSDEHADEVTRRLEALGAVDLEQREAEWRAAGWNAPQPAARVEASALEGSRAEAESERIPVVEERLRVGKREVNRGGVRVRSYIVEEPVHEDVLLREERVEVERRPVNQTARPVAKGSPEDLLQERTVELEETAEQAVIGKEAVITEEVRVRKAAEEHVERIDETVRHTEVDVEDNRAGAAGRRPVDTPPPARR
jgi:uncharacterized protein (TIGR02271 family)